MTNIPPGVTSLGTYTFEGCPNVKIASFGNVENGNSITNIGTLCFHRAGRGNFGSDVTKIVIGSSVRTIGLNAFNGYGNIKEVTIYLENGETADKFDINAIGLGGAQVEHKFQ